MALIHWRPLSFNDMFEETHRTFDLATDVYEENQHIMVKMHVPGIDPDNIDISIENEYLHVSGNRQEREETEDQEYYRKEIRTGSFERLIPLPSPVDESQTQARYKDGVLTISLLKKHKEDKRSRVRIDRE